MNKIAKYIVDKWFFFLALFIFIGVYCAFKLPDVNVNYDMTKYLPSESVTSVAINIMNDQFGDHAQANVMVKNVSLEKAQEVKKTIEETDGVMYVTFNGDVNDYVNGNALYVVMFDTGDCDLETGNTIELLRSNLAKYDTALNGTAISMKNMKDAIQEQMPRMLLIVCIIIILVLFFTSKSYIEPVVFVIVIGMSVLINLGTNAWLDSVSFITNSICAIMQLAIAMDYAIMLLHRYLEEKENYSSNEEALTEALAQSITSISASSLTTIAGLFAITQIQFSLGYDVGIVLIKGIVCSMLTVFLFMPGVILLFDKVIDKTRHKSFIPSMDKLSGFVCKTKHILPVILITLICICCVYQFKLEYDYSLTTIGANCSEESTKENEAIEDTYGKSTLFVVLVPKGEYEKEKELTDYLEGLKVNDWKAVNTVQGLAATELRDSYTAKEFAKKFNIPTVAAMAVYRYLGKDPNKSVMMEDIVNAAYDNKDTFIMSFFKDDVIALKEQADEGLELLESGRYSRILFSVDAAADSEEAFNLVEILRRDIAGIYGDDFYLFGDTVNMYDIKSTFGDDITKANLVTVILIGLILLLTFNSLFLAIILVAVVQGAVWINMALVVLKGAPAFFCNPVIVNCIQMGATIDYAILLTTRYRDARSEGLSKEEACHAALTAAMPTILTSGTILCVAGYVIGLTSTISVVSEIGLLLGRGSIIAILLVVFLVPQLLMLGDNIVTSKKVSISEFVEKFKNEKVSKLITPEGAVVNTNAAPKEEEKPEEVKPEEVKPEEPRPEEPKQEEPKEEEPKAEEPKEDPSNNAEGSNENKENVSEEPLEDEKKN